MKNFIQTIKNIWKIKELRERILFTLGLLLIYRIGSNIYIPGINIAAIASQKEISGFASMVDLFAGGAFSKVSIFALGIMPYISASIVMQLVGIAYPPVQKLQREGESGRRKITQITRILTVVICLAQAPSYLATYASDFLLFENFSFMYFQAIILMIVGTLFAMWIGERITEKGIGNGISLLIMVGIIARLPQSMMQEFSSLADRPIFIVVEVAALFLVILASILVVQAVRKIPVQYARKVVGNTPVGGAREYLPFKLNSAGVMPIIFAQALMIVPGLFGNTGNDTIDGIMADLVDYRSLPYNLLVAFLIIAFTYFYTAITIRPTEIADNLKRSGAFVPGVKPGQETAEFMDTVLSRLTLPGSIFLAIIAILPAFAGIAGVDQNFAMFFGGTSLLILVGVVLDTLQQINSYLLNSHYDGLMKGGKLKNREVIPSGF